MCETIKDQISRLGYVGCDVLEDIRTWVTVLERLLDVLDVAVEITGSQDSLFPESPNCKSPEIMKLTKKMEDIDITPFYGSALGFQFRGDSRRMMYPLAVSMASYSDIFVQHQGVQDATYTGSSKKKSDHIRARET